MADYLSGTWLPHIRTRVRPRTSQRYQQLLELHVVPLIGSVKMAKLQPAHVQQVVDAATASGLAPRTVAGVYRTLHAALRQAIRWHLLSVNPAAAIDPPRAERAKLETPEAAKVAKVLDAARGTRLYVRWRSSHRRGSVEESSWRSSGGTSNSTGGWTASLRRSCV